VLLKFQKIKLNENGLKVNSVNLGLRKYEFGDENEKSKERN
jgi:hypothetical protein